MWRSLHCSLGLLTFLALACHRQLGEPEDERLTVDAEVVARGLCSLKCYRLGECGLAPDDSCEDTCVEEALDALPGDPCWTQWIEVRRCGVRWATCDGVADETIPPSAESTCAPKLDRLAQCEMD